MRLYGAMMLSESGDDRRNIMTTTIQQIHPVAHLPLVLGVLRRLEVATIIDRLIPPHPAHGLSCGRGVEALVLAIEECLALGLEGVRGIVADSKAYSRRPLGLCLEHGIGLVTLVPRTCAIRQELEAWGCQHPPLPLLAEKPGRTRDEAPRRWHGQSVRRQVEVEYSDGRVAQEEVRFVVVHSSQLAQQQTQTYAAAQGKEAKAVVDHVRQVHARWFACRPDAEAAIAEYEDRAPERRGRRSHPWRYHTVRYHLVAATRRTRRARRGQPAKTGP